MSSVGSSLRSPLEVSAWLPPAAAAAALPTVRDGGGGGNGQLTNWEGDGNGQLTNCTHQPHSTSALTSYTIQPVLSPLLTLEGHRPNHSRFRKFTSGLRTS
jgi:hypothetical protein